MDTANSTSSMAKTVSFALPQQTEAPHIEHKEAAIVMEEEEVDTSQKFRKRSSLCSRFFISWTIPTIYRGFRKRLEKEDVPLLEEDLDCEVLLKQAIHEWEDICTNNPKEKQTVLRLFLRMEKRNVIIGITFSVLQGLLFSVGRPLLIRQVVSATANLNSPMANAFGIVVAFSIVVLSDGFFSAFSRQLLANESGTRFWAWASGLLEWKAIRIDSSEKMGNDVAGLMGYHLIRVVDEWKWGFMIFFSSTCLIGGICVLSVTLQLAALPGLGIFLVVFLMNMAIGRSIRHVDKRGHDISATRISLTQDLTANVLGLKMAAWEEPYKKLLTDIRRQDTANIQNGRARAVTSINLGRASPIIAASISIVVLAAVYPENLTATTIFTALTSFQGLRLPLISLPTNLISIQNAFVTFERLRTFLMLPDAKKTGT